MKKEKYFICKSIHFNWNFLEILFEFISDNFKLFFILNGPDAKLKKCHNSY